MKIGDRVELLEKVEMHTITYQIGHRFKIVGEDSMRGYNLEDDDGNRLDETRFLKFRLDRAVQRAKKIKTILK
jgi:hypothetical protein